MRLALPRLRRLRLFPSRAIRLRPPPPKPLQLPPLRPPPEKSSWSASSPIQNMSGMRAATIHLPEKWHFESKIEWHYDWVEYPLSYSAHAENPDNAEAYFQYPTVAVGVHRSCASIEAIRQEPQTSAWRAPAHGRPFLPPQPPMQAMAMFIKKTRPNVTNFKWIGQQDLPDLAKVLHLDPWPNQHGVAIKIGYDLNGQPVEEAFFGVYYISQGANEGVNAGMIKQTNWGFQALQSLRAPAGTLDKRMPMFCVIAKSMYVNPEWVRLSKAINDKMLADFNQKLKQGYDQLRAAQAIVDQTMKQQAAFQANFDKQEEAFRNSGGVDDSYLRDGGARSAADHWDDMIRGVDTVNDPSNGGTTQLSNLGQYHFTDGFGNYRTTDDPNYTPEKAGENGSWSPQIGAVVFPRGGETPKELKNPPLPQFSVGMTPAWRICGVRLPIFCSALERLEHFVLLECPDSETCQSRNDIFLQSFVDRIRDSLQHNPEALRETLVFSEQRSSNLQATHHADRACHSLRRSKAR